MGKENIEVFKSKKPAESHHSVDIPREVYNVRAPIGARLSQAGRAIRKGGHTLDVIGEAYGTGMAALGNIPGSQELIRFVTRIPEATSAIHWLNLSPRDAIIGALVLGGEESTRKLATRTMRRIYRPWSENTLRIQK